MSGTPAYRAGSFFRIRRVFFRLFSGFSTGSELRNGSLRVVLTAVRAFASVKERSASPLQQRRPCGIQDGRTHCRSEEHTSELQSHVNLVCRLLLEKKNNNSTDRDISASHS